MNKLSKFIPVVNFCWIEFTLSKVWYKTLTFDFLNLCLEESGEFVTKELASIQYCSPSRHFGWKTGDFMFQKCEFGQNVNLGKSNWQITGYPASLRKIDAAALNCNLHPKRLSILKLKIWLDFAQHRRHISGKAGSAVPLVWAAEPVGSKCMWLTLVISHQVEMQTFMRGLH